jgi:hypothetical protein
MEGLVHKGPSVGSLVKKLLEINPELMTSEMIEIIRQSVQTQGRTAGEFASAETVDVDKAVALAKASLQKGQSKCRL